MVARKLREPLGPRICDKKGPESRKQACECKTSGHAVPGVPAALLVLLISPVTLLSLKHLGFERVLMTECVLKINSLLLHGKEFISVANCRPKDPKPHLNIKFQVPADMGINQILYSLSVNPLLKGHPEHTATHL